MTTRDVITGYFSNLKQQGDWKSFLSDDIVFTSFTSPVKQVRGKAAYLEATRRFYSTIRAVDVKDLLIDDQRACVLTHYRLQAPGRKAFESDIAEVFRVRAEKIATFDIYFDSAPFPK
jgi:ketosteroid isomerase-like protein